MGATFSGFVEDQSSIGSVVSSPSKPSLGDLPENCISSILTHFDPPEICKLARLNRAFRSASRADFVWKSKLPSNYKFLVNKVLHEDSEKLAKKDIYARLCRHNHFDHGTKEVWLDKSSGKVFMSISSKALRITGIDDRRYWNYIATEESRKIDFEVVLLKLLALDILFWHVLFNFFQPPICCVQDDDLDRTHVQKFDLKALANFS
ncbi:hypothetical protein I3842_03G098100 [Carya illinoinensis]|uniref:F-box domain-containing protein n=1 Tax=Carya illinoinensis TaxID=32201 RepID=A0A922JUP6_CARIL|nr:hypothetical protein I3842_03G098100 [Carya illinoinensis]